MKYLKMLPWIAGAVFVLLVAQRALFPAVRVADGAMEPTLYRGQLMLINRLAYLGRAPRRGEIIACRAAVDGSLLFRRVLALPGDSVALHQGRLFLNGLPAGPPPRRPTTAPAAADSFPRVVPDGEIYVVAEDDAAGADSRNFGPLPLASVSGPAIRIGR